MCAQALILRELGYEVEEGALWFAQSRKRVIVPISATLIEQTRSDMNGLREAILCLWLIHRVGNVSM